MLPVAFDGALNPRERAAPLASHASSDRRSPPRTSANASHNSPRRTLSHLNRRMSRDRYLADGAGSSTTTRLLPSTSLGRSGSRRYTVRSRRSVMPASSATSTSVIPACSRALIILRTRYGSSASNSAGSRHSPASNAGSTTTTVTDTTPPSAARPHHVPTTSRELTARPLQKRAAPICGPFCVSATCGRGLSPARRLSR